MTYGKRNGRQAALLGTSILAALAATGPALAQTQAQAAGTADEALEQIVVTGSRIKRSGFDASTPVTSVDAVDLKLSGAVNPENLLNTLPQFVPSADGTSRSNSPGTGQAFVDLRGFGPTRNLVLVNGRRFTISDTLQRTDINTIPAALIERTEIVTGGSSAVYGSDAITGVVNFIMRDDFEGVEARWQTGFDSRTATPTHDFNLTMGGNFADGRGNAVVSANYLKRNEILQGTRAFSRFALNDGTDGQGDPTLVRGGSGFVPNTRFTGIPSGAGLDVRGREDLGAALDAAGLGELGALGFLPDDSGLNVRPFVNPGDLFNFAPDNFLQIPQERWAITGFGHYDFHEKATGWVEASFSNNRVDRQLAPSPMNGPVLLAIDNPFLSDAMRDVLRELDLQEGRVIGRVTEEDGTVIDPGEVCRYAAGADPTVCDPSAGLFSQNVVNGAASMANRPGDGFTSLSVARRLNQVGPRQFLDERNAWRVALGFRGDLGDVDRSFLRDLAYDVYYSFARTQNTSRTENVPSRSRFFNILLPGSAPDGGTLGNIFGQNITPEAAAAIAVGATDITTSQLQVIAGNVTGELFDLPAGPVGFSFGGEWRSASAGFIPDEFLGSGDIAGFGPQSSTRGNVRVKEVFGEVRVPLLADLPFMESLIANSAFRLSDYNLDRVGSVWTFLGGADWRVSRDLAFRGQFQRAIRAPTVGELFDDQSEGAQPADDPCAQPSAIGNATIRELCVATGVPASLVGDPGVQPNQQVTVLTGGNPNLDAERSDTYTLGAVYTPRAVPGLSLSIDWFDIKLTDAIDALAGGAANALNLCFNVIQDIDSAVCQSVVRNPANGEITTPFNMLLFNVNIGKIKTEGVDLGLRYNFDADFGLLSETSSFDIAMNATWMDKFTVTPVQELPDRRNFCVGAFGSNCGEPKPEFKATTRVTWNTGPLSVSLRHRFIDAVKDDRILIARRIDIAGPGPGDLPSARLSTQHYLDLSFTFDVLENLQFYGGANNITDNTPPLVGNGQSQANTFPSTFDSLGTEIFAGAVIRF